MKRVVIDPGVLVSAALSETSTPARILAAVRSGRFVMITSPKLLAELEDVLSRPRIAARLDAQALAHLRQVLAAAPVTEDPPTVAVSRDPKDDYLIALAQGGEADYLVSGDGDLTVLADLIPPPVRTPTAFLAEMETW